MRSLLRSLLILFLFLASPAWAGFELTAGENIAAGDVLRLNVATQEAFRADSATDYVIGVAKAAATLGNSVRIATSGEMVYVNCDAGVTTGEFLEPSVTDGVTSAGSAIRGLYTFGQALSNHSGGQCLMSVQTGGDGRGILGVEVTATDTGQDYLNSSVDAGDNIVKEIVNPGADERLKLHSRTTAKEDGTTIGAGTDIVNLDLGPGLDGAQSPAGTFRFFSDPDEIAGIALSELVFFAPMDNTQTNAPSIQLGNGDWVAASASGVGWRVLHRFDGDAHDNGTEALSPAAGTALPSGVTSVPGGLDFGGDGSTNNFINNLTKPTFSITAAENFTWVMAFKSSTVSALEWLVSTEDSTTNGLDSFISSTGVSLRMRIVAAYDSAVVNTAVDDGVVHAVAGIWDQSNTTSFLDGALDTQVAKSRTGTLTHGAANMYVGGRDTETVGVLNGQLYFDGMYEGLVPRDFGLWWTNNWPATEIIGRRSVQGKFGEGRLYIGGDYETYASEVFRPLKSEGTLSLWYQPIYNANTTTITADCVIFEQAAAGGEGWRLDYDPGVDKFVATLVTGSGTVTASSSAVETFSAGDWVHLGMSWDGTNLELHVNGVSQQAPALGAEPTPSGEMASTFRIGNSGTANEPANGVVDHVKGASTRWTTAQFALEFAATRP